MERDVTFFMIHKLYLLQIVVINISLVTLEAEFLVDIPQGSIVLQSHEETVVSSVRVGPFETKVVERQFYFPSEGNFELYPANATRQSEIIAKASPLSKLTVSNELTQSSSQSLDSILKSGRHE